MIIEEDANKIDLVNANEIKKKMTNMPMTSFSKQEDPSRLETAYDTMVSPNTALVIKEEHYMPKPTHSRKLSYPEQSAFSQIEYAEL